jgi:hypothetical protein
VRVVFSDVVDEFCTIRDVASRFENWRSTDSVAYREAYVSLCLPKVLGPLVRLKTLMWNPLQVNPAMINVEMYMHKHWLDRWVLASYWRSPLSVSRQTAKLLQTNESVSGQFSPNCRHSPFHQCFLYSI